MCASSVIYFIYAGLWFGLSLSEAKPSEDVDEHFAKVCKKRRVKVSSIRILFSWNGGMQQCTGFKLGRGVWDNGSTPTQGAEDQGACWINSTTVQWSI